MVMAYSSERYNQQRERCVEQNPQETRHQVRVLSQWFTQGALNFLATICDSTTEVHQGVGTLGLVGHDHILTLCLGCTKVLGSQRKVDVQLKQLLVRHPVQAQGPILTTQVLMLGTLPNLVPRLQPRASLTRKPFKDISLRLAMLTLLYRFPSCEFCWSLFVMYLLDLHCWKSLRKLVKPESISIQSVGYCHGNKQPKSINSSKQ